MLHPNSDKSSVVFPTGSQNVDLDIQGTSGWTVDNFAKTRNSAFVEEWRHTVRRDHSAGMMLWPLLALQVAAAAAADDEDDDEDDDALLDCCR